MDLQLSAPTLFNDSPKLAPDTVLGSKYLDPGFWFGKEVSFFDQLSIFVNDPSVIETYRIILSLFSIFFIAIIFYTIIRLFEIRKKEKMHLHHEMEEYARHNKEKERSMAEGDAISKNERWRAVLQLLFSTSSNDWKLSILEADAMLDLLLTNLGFQGENLGEKLKKAGEQGFRQLSSAWEVHSLRNRIAHESSIFELSHHEAKRVIAIYELIFREFGYI